MDGVTHTEEHILVDCGQQAVTSERLKIVAVVVLTHLLSHRPLAQGRGQKPRHPLQDCCVWCGSAPQPVCYCLPLCLPARSVRSTYCVLGLPQMLKREQT